MDVGQHLRKILFLLPILVFEFSFGQKIESSPVQEKNTNSPMYWTTDNCSDIENVFLNSQCVNKELNGYLLRNAVFPEYLSSGFYYVSMKVTVDKKGNLTGVVGYNGEESLYSEIERVLKLYPNHLYLVDNNGNFLDDSGLMRFRIEITD